MVKIRNGFADADRLLVAKLYWEAFGAKLGKVLGPKEKAEAFILSALDPEFAITAYDGDKLLGVAGLKTKDGALLGGSFADLKAFYGFFGALWRGIFLDMLERELTQDELLMDGIFVTKEARGKGIGSQLLAAIEDKARTAGKTSVRLDVINTNPRAKELYAKRGYTVKNKSELGILRHVFGFDSSETMVLDLTSR